MTDSVTMKSFNIIVLWSLSCLAKERCDSNMVHSELLDFQHKHQTCLVTKFISVPVIMLHHRASKFLKYFLILISLVYFDKLADHWKSLYIKPRPSLLLGAFQNHVLFPRPLFRLNLQPPNNLTSAKHLYKLCWSSFEIDHIFQNIYDSELLRIWFNRTFMHIDKTHKLILITKCGGTLLY